LIYVSTSAEANDLYTAREHKKALDRYWLGLPVGNNVTLAKRTIKSFYQRVESANRYFTSYKEGWKTDRGMIFIVMGLPAKISKNKDQEIWTYNRQGQYSEVNFTFNRRNNQFSENHYELLRYAEYQPIWYPAVESWRNGEMASR
jgi:GWxTD domain-containing protein